MTATTQIYPATGLTNSTYETLTDGQAYGCHIVNTDYDGDYILKIKQFLSNSAGIGTVKQVVYDTDGTTVLASSPSMDVTTLPYPAAFVEFTLNTAVQVYDDYRVVTEVTLSSGNVRAHLFYNGSTLNPNAGFQFTRRNSSSGSWTNSSPNEYKLIPNMIFDSDPGVVPTPTSSTLFPPPPIAWI